MSIDLIDAKNLNVRQLMLGNALVAAAFAAFIIWAETHPKSLWIASLEDGPVEYISALLFGLSSIGFLLAMKRSEFLKQKSTRWAYCFTAAWAVLMFIFMAEEVSWGQRMFGFGTPESMVEYNTQEEFNLHNMFFLSESYSGGWVTYRYLSIMMLATGFLLPIVALGRKGVRLFRKLALPVLPICYMGFFVGSILYGRYYYDLLPSDTATEVRELMLAIGMFCFALHGAMRPDDLFRLRKKA